MPTTKYNSIQTKLQTTLSRRAILGQLITLGALAAVPLATGLPPTEAPTAADSIDIQLIPPNPVLYTDGHGPAERTEAIRRWYWRFDVLIQLGEKMQAFLEDAHGKAPAEVDGLKMLTLQWEILDKFDELTGQFETGELEEDYELITGWRSYVWCLKHAIQTSELLKLDEIQLEIDAIRPDDPAAAAILQALLDARIGVQR